MTSLTAERVGSQMPRLQQRPARAVGSAGDDAIEFAESIGYELDEWQKFCVRGLLSEDASARLCALVSLILVARQNGKNVVLEVVELYAFYVLGFPLILHTAHLQETTADHMARLWSAIESDEDLVSITRQVVANGKERIWRTDTRAQIKFKTRSKKVGRGGSPRMVVFDEALYLTDEQIQAMLPSLSAQSLRGDAPILIYTSSAPVDESTVLLRVRKAISDGQMPDAFYAEWSAAFEPAEHETRDSAMRRVAADRANWYVANPGMGVRIGAEWVQANEVPMLSLEAFLIERLGVVFDESGGLGAIPTWSQLVDVGSRIAAHRSIALDVSPSRSSASLAWAGRRADGLVHVHAFDNRPGTIWVLDACRALWAKWNVPIRIQTGSPAASFIDLLGAEKIGVEEVTVGDHAQAVGQLLDTCAAMGLRHLDDPALNAAVTAAELRPSSDAYVWGRRLTSSDITPLVAVTLALGGVPKVAPDFFVY